MFRISLHLSYKNPYPNAKSAQNPEAALAFPELLQLTLKQDANIIFIQGN